MISTHILDLHRGQPAENVEVTLEKKFGESWKNIESSSTNKDGRIKFSQGPEAGTYRLNFKIVPYFKAQGLAAFFTEVPVIFEITDTNRNYHVPLLLNQFGYSTYRGS